MRGVSRRIQRAGLVQGQPAPCQANRLIGVSIRRHRIDLGLECGPVVAQRHKLNRASIVLLGDKQGGRVARHRRSALDIVVLIPVGYAAIPGAVLFGRTNYANRTANAIAVAVAIVAVAVAVISVAVSIVAVAAATAEAAGLVGGVPI